MASPPRSPLGVHRHDVMGDVERADGKAAVGVGHGRLELGLHLSFALLVMRFGGLLAVGGPELRHGGPGHRLSVLVNDPPTYFPLFIGARYRNRPDTKSHQDGRAERSVA